MSSFSREIINPPISFLWIENADADSISRAIGESVFNNNVDWAFVRTQGKL